MQIALISKAGHSDTGVGRYTIELERSLENLGHQVTVVHPIIPVPSFLLRWLERWPGIDLEAFFNHYPVRVCYPQADIYHFTGQNLATMLLVCRPPGKSVVTVHDLIPWLVSDNPELRVYRHRFEGLFDRMALAGLKRADALISVSYFSNRSLQTVIGRSETRIML